MESHFEKKVAIIGLGLIGGSLAKALKKKTNATVYGFDKNKNVLAAALKQGAIDSVLDISEQLREMDVTISCLYARESLSFVLKHKNQFQKGSLVMDVCGVKQMVVDPIEAMPHKEFFFVGAHPMAGKEKVGYLHSDMNLFQNASMILTPLSDTPTEILKDIERLSLQLGFKKVVVTTTKHHDRVIALTSQLCHVVSSAFVQSSTAQEFDGFSAGSFQDLTRVAKLNPQMWAELFVLNRDALLQETQTLIDKLEKFKEAIATSNRRGLEQLLQAGTEIKEGLMEKS